MSLSSNHYKDLNIVGDLVDGAVNLKFERLMSKCQPLKNLSYGNDLWLFRIQESALWSIQNTPPIHTLHSRNNFFTWCFTASN